jgi:signal transduction histidine kinase
MRYSEPFDALVFQHEMLHSQLAIRNHYLKSVVIDIYENTGQLLSLIRVQLSLIKDRIAQQSDPGIEATSQLVAEVVSNLRDMSKGFYPERELSEAQGLINAVNNEMRIIPDNNNSTAEVLVKGKTVDLPAAHAILLFHTALNMIEFIKQQENTFCRTTILYGKTNLCLRFTYTGEAFIADGNPVAAAENAGIALLNPAERMALIGGSVQVISAGSKAIQADIILPVQK